MQRSSGDTQASALGCSKKTEWTALEMIVLNHPSRSWNLVIKPIFPETTYMLNSSHKFDQFTSEIKTNFKCLVNRWLTRNQYDICRQATNQSETIHDATSNVNIEISGSQDWKMVLDRERAEEKL
jgi:hypothetical protein